MGNDVCVLRAGRRVRGVHQRDGDTGREPFEAFVERYGGGVHVDDVGDNIHGADASAGTAGDE